jgi:hypothetical protein
MVKLKQVVSAQLPISAWRVRVDPALGRTLDLAIGEGLVERLTRTSGPAYRLTAAGNEAAAALAASDALVAEREFLDDTVARISEAFVERLIRMRQS